MPASAHAELAALVERFCPREGLNSTPITGLHLFRHVAPTAPIHGVYSPTLCLIAQGAKSVTMGEQSYLHDPAHFFLVTVDVPFVAYVTEATPDAPYLGVSLSLDAAQIGALVAEANLPPAPANGVAVRGIGVGCVDAPLLDAATRLLRLLETPGDIPVLAPMVMREICYRILTGDQGAKLRRVALRHGETEGIVEALNWIKANYAAPLHIERIARDVHMSESGFHHHFKAVTAMTPLQYQKQLRLQEARRLMLGESTTVALASQNVGYESASQFSREYRRLFGDSPQRDIARLRQNNIESG